MAIKTLKRTNQRRNQQKRTQKGGMESFKSLFSRTSSITYILKGLIKERDEVSQTVKTLPTQIKTMYNKIKLGKKVTDLNLILFDYFNRMETLASGDSDPLTLGGGSVWDLEDSPGESEKTRTVNEKLLDMQIMLYIKSLYQDFINRSLQPAIITLYILGLHIPEYYVKASIPILFSSNIPRWWQLIIQKDILSPTSYRSTTTPVSRTAATVNTVASGWESLTIGYVNEAESEHNDELNAINFVDVLTKLKKLIDTKRKTTLTKDESDSLMIYLGSTSGPQYGFIINKYLANCLEESNQDAEIKKQKPTERSSVMLDALSTKKEANNKTTHVNIITKLITDTPEIKTTRNLATCFNLDTFMLDLKYNTTIKAIKKLPTSPTPMWFIALVNKSKEVFGRTDIEQAELLSRIDKLHSATGKTLPLTPALTPSEIEARRAALSGPIDEADLLARLAALRGTPPGGGGGGAAGPGTGPGPGAGPGGAAGPGGGAAGRKKKKKTSMKKKRNKKSNKPRRGSNKIK